MWIVINNEMWNTDNLDGIVAEDNQVVFVFKNHSERYQVKDNTDVGNTMVSLEIALKEGHTIWNGLPDYLQERDDEVIYNRFG